MVGHFLFLDFLFSIILVLLSKTKFSKDKTIFCIGKMLSISKEVVTILPGIEVMGVVLVGPVI
jgi:hypothetical protein